VGSLVGSLKRMMSGMKMIKALALGEVAATEGSCIQAPIIYTKASKEANHFILLFSLISHLFFASFLLTFECVGSESCKRVI
jgi:hypothetical protein